MQITLTRFASSQIFFEGGKKLYKPVDCVILDLQSYSLKNLSEMTPLALLNLCSQYQLQALV